MMDADETCALKVKLENLWGQVESGTSRSPARFKRRSLPENAVIESESPIASPCPSGYQAAPWTEVACAVLSNRMRREYEFSKQAVLANDQTVTARFP
jgi:hypothetical protein